ncbi:uncharacterized protein OCT59_029904 [Rhizophagus irregularis]|uniref:uncharacterized protein n=1 Tax=Rhizophagus irregularis TaxID=588596 RepID=UPI0033239ED9|nr:hypothetical protein OCT59_029904 [Rhizophagus irregularis]
MKMVHKRSQNKLQERKNKSFSNNKRKRDKVNSLNETIENKDKEITQLKRQKTFAVELYQQKLNQIIEIENKLENETIKLQMSLSNNPVTLKICYFYLTTRSAYCTIPIKVSSTLFVINFVLFFVPIFPISQKILSFSFFVTSKTVVLSLDSRWSDTALNVRRKNELLALRAREEVLVR